MKTELKKIDNTKRELFIEETGDIVKNKFEEAFNKINQEARVSGFRPGHIPRDILEKKFLSEANEFVLKELIPDTFDAAVKQESLDVLDAPNISCVKLERNYLSFKAEVEVRPALEVKNYKGIKLNYQRPSVSPDEIKRNMDSLKESRKIDNLGDNFAKSLGYPDIIALEETIKAQVFIQKQNQEYGKLENQIIKGIMKDLDFKAPQVLVNRQLQEMLKQAEVDMMLKGVPREKISEQEKKLSEELLPQSKEQVRIYLVLSEIAKRENIPEDEYMMKKVMEFLFREADWKESSE